MVEGMDSEAGAPLAPRVLVGEITGLFGVRGWVKIFSYTQPRHNILEYSPWYVQIENGWTALEVAEGQVHGHGIIARLAGCDNREAALRFLKTPIMVLREQLLRPENDEYYWVDLIGLEVVTTQGQLLGTVHHLFETGANDVLVVRGERERWVPFVRDHVVHRVDLKERRIIIDWDPEF